MSPDIYTIGYGNRRIEDFLSILKKYNVDLLIDIRTRPFSRFNPDFRAKKLELHLINNDIRYLFLGRELGGKPTDPDCYTKDEVDYLRVQEKGFFREGIQEVLHLHKKGCTVALMCAELSPNHCHRKALVGDYLEKRNFPVRHIDKIGSIQNELF